MSDKCVSVNQKLIENAWPAGLEYNILTLKPRRKNWCLFLVLLLSVAAWPGFTALKGLTFSKKKLEHPNPTSYVFTAPVAEVKTAIDASISSTHQEGRLYGYWMPSGLDFHGSNETEYDLHQASMSDMYHWWRTSLDYSADFKLQLTPVSDSKTRVDVQTSESKVRIGPNFGAHGGESYEPVTPTTIEEYRILLKIGSALGERGMPPLQLP